MYILVGSTYFFSKFEDFKGGNDFVELVDNPISFEFVRQTISNSENLFEWKHMTPEEFIEYALTKGPAMQLGKFLVPEFNSQIGFTFEHLKQLRPLVDSLDDKHKYEKVIYEAYIVNNDFTLTDEQLNNAYEVYKKYREDVYKGSVINE